MLGGIPRHPGSRLQALGVRIALRRSRQHADQLRTHDQQALLVIDGQAGVLLGEAIHQRLVDSRSQGSGTEIATDRFGGQTSHQGVQADLAEAAVVQYAMGGVANQLEAVGRKGICQAVLQRIAQAALAAQRPVQQHRSTILQQLVRGELAHALPGAQPCGGRHGPGVR